MGYLGGVEQTCSFGARNDACGHAVGDACDEVADVVRSGELGHAGAVAETTGFAGNGRFASLSEIFLDLYLKHSAANFDSEVERGVISSQLGELCEHAGKRLHLFIELELLCFIDDCLTIGDVFQEIYRHDHAFRVEDD